MQGEQGTVTYSLTEGPNHFGFWMRMYRPGSPNRYPEPDGTGSTRMMADGHGVITDSYTMTAFGQQLSSTGTTYNPFRFGGQWGYYTDSDGSALVQMGARFYWPEIGRFIQQDQLGYGMNWYAYAGDNPVTWVDPDGLRRRRGLRQWLRDQGRAVQDAVDGLGDMAIDPFMIDPADLPTFAQRNPGLGDLQRCLGRGAGFDAPGAMRNYVAKPLMWATAGAALAAAGEFGGGRRPSLKDLRSPNQEALVALLAEVETSGVTAEEAGALTDWATELGYENVHGPMVHADKGGWTQTGLHITIGKYHIPVRTR